ncbi:MAG: cupin [Caulobacter sp.]|nr:cupin [Caulobacter sp.]
MQSAQTLIHRLDLKPHPEGGWFRETFRDPHLVDGRAASTAIYYLLERGQRSHWHRVDAVEAWHFHAGAPLMLGLADSLGVAQPDVMLGPDVTSHERPQAIVPKGWWQSAQSTGEWTLVGCTVAPGFEYDGFEMAPEGWAPSRG